MLRCAWTLLFALNCILESAQAEVLIESRPNPLQIQTNKYQAKVDWDGCLTSLRADGQEFLASNVSISRGTYFFYLGPVQQKKVEQPEADTIVATGDLTSIEYSFADDGMVWKLSNHSNVDLVFFMVFASDMDGLQGSEGDIAKTPITSESNSLTCYRGKACLEVDGFSKIWGPWQGPHQVGQVDLKAGAKKEIRLRFREIKQEEHQEIVKLNSLPPDSDITILSPRAYQIFQRKSEEEGEVLVSGRLGVPAEEVQIRLSGKPREGVLANQWTSVPVVSPLREFNTRLIVPAGGWYSLEARVMAQGNEIAKERIDKFGVGEVFVGAGQSNSTNYGEFKTQQKSGMVASFSGKHWQIADDPQPGVADSSQGGSFWPAFGDAMYEKYGVPIGVATTGYGGTSVNQWEPGGGLFRDWMMVRIHQLGPGGFRALLWHQGESDITMPADEYYAKLRTVIVSSRAQAGWEFPWFVAQASYHNPEKLKFENVRQAQAKLWKDKVAIAGPDTDTLTGDHRDLEGKGIHFSPKGLKAHGEMWAGHAGGYLDEILSADQ